MKKLKMMLKYMKKYKGRYILGILALFVVDILQLIPPRILGRLSDGIANKSISNISVAKNLLLIIVLSIIIAISRFFWRIFIIGTSRKIEYDLRNKLFSRLEKLSINFYNKNKTGDLMALATNDLNAFRMSLGQGIVMMFDAIFLTVITLSIMLSINVKLTLISLIPLPLVSIVATNFGKLIHKRFLKVQEVFAKLTDVVQENFSGIRVIKTFAQEANEYVKFNEQNREYLKANMNLVKVWGILFPLTELLAYLSFVILIAVGASYVVLNIISIGDFIAFNMYLGSLVWPMMAIGWVINVVQRGYASLERIENVLNQSIEIYDKNVDNVTSLDGDIIINNLNFQYESSKSPALKNINLHIRKGESLGIIGKTGSGKSTLVNLLIRLYNVQDGTIFINGHDINKIPISILRKKIGFVPQESFLFSKSVAENIALPLYETDDDKVIKYAKIAEVHEDIIGFNDGYKTIVGERGITLSGGQKQRISIARALIKEPEILIFDDCLSAVDAKTENRILKNLKEVMKGKTSIVISHRISAIKDCDNIIVLDEGRIVESGNHNQLIENDGLYKKIYLKQQIEEKLEEAE
ncbi:ABC transporter ATP-binding protein [Caloramator australicus]|nr:ABC transporter ATP-binding protein [Caloramator australicus]